MEPTGPVPVDTSNALDKSLEGCYKDNMSKPPKPLWTVKEVAAYLKVTSDAVRRWLNANQLRGFKMKNQWRVSWPDLDRFIKQNSNMAPAR